MGRSGTNKNSFYVSLPPDVVEAFRQFKEANFPDSSDSAVLKELVITALSKSVEIGVLDATRRAEALRTRAWMFDRIVPFFRELIQTVEVAAGELHREQAQTEGETRRPG